ncbi:MAG: toll/interleukin-1 receptor domain-containing protein [Candidatus Paceibacterota bacterium]
MKPPRVFISYSHDSSSHKKWVLEFATTLRNRGIDAVLDQWDLKPGDDLPHFMETQLSDSDYILMICTEMYVGKANSGEGGVGYEKMIITSSLLKSIDNNIVIPIIRQDGSTDIPTFLKTKLYIDFSKDSDIEYKFDDLIRTLLNAPLYEKPPIGKNPFKEVNESAPARTSDAIKQLMTDIASGFSNWEYDWLPKRRLLRASSMHRLTLDKYLSLASEQGLLRVDESNYIYLSDKGRKYLFDKEILSD